MKAIILVAGYATRLYPLTLNMPKALLEINKKPIIDYIVDKLNEVDADWKIRVHLSRKRDETLRINTFRREKHNRRHKDRVQNHREAGREHKAGFRSMHA